MSSSHGRTAQVVLLTAGAAVCLILPLLGNSQELKAGIFLVSEVAALAVLTAAILAIPDRPRLVWWWLLASLAATAVGDLIYLAQQILGEEPPFPGWADVLYLGQYLAAFTCLVLIVRGRHAGRGITPWLDTLIITLAGAAVLGVAIIQPMLTGRPVSWQAAALSITYPLLDLAVFAALVRLMVDPGRRNRALTLLTCAFGVFLIADTLYNYDVVYTTDVMASAWLDSLYLAPSLLMAAAALSPDAGAIAQPVRRVRRPASAANAVFVAIGSLVAPFLLIILIWPEGSVLERFLGVTSMAVIGLVLWRLQLLIRTVRRQSEQLAAQARSDSLTGLPNRRSLDYEIDRLNRSLAHTYRPLTVAMLDLDHFKTFNDLNGHPAGDDLLAACARAWAVRLGRADFLARYGGEEFALLLPGTGAEEALPILESLRRATPGGQTVSIGFAGRYPDEDCSRALERADEALYAAKRGGRNRVVESQPTGA